MENILMMMIAFGVLCGIALLFKTFLKVNMGEGIMLSSGFIILALFLSSYAGSFYYGMYVIVFIAVIGVFSWLIKGIKNRKWDIKSIFSPVFMILFILFAGSLIIYHNDFIQHIDEFHEWAAAVKYMLVHDRMPTGPDFIGGGGQYGFATSLFHLFFQRITGYSEQNMYVSAALLSWIGFMLPFSEHTWKEWKKVLIYVLIVYIGLFSLYSYGSKSLYVDIPLAAWSVGLAGWWINRKKKKSNVLMLSSGLVLLHFFKQSSGFLMAVMVGIFVLLQSIIVEKGVLKKKNGVKHICILTGVLCGAIILGSVLLLTAIIKLEPYEPEYVQEAVIEEDQQSNAQSWSIAGVRLPDRISDTINIVKLSKEKASLSLGSFIKSFFGIPLSSKSNYNLTCFALLILVLILIYAYGELYDCYGESIVYICYAIFMSLSYLTALFFSYLFMFAYELSVNMRSVSRYFSGCCIYLFVFALVLLLRPQKAKKEKIQEYTAYGLLFFFALGLNTKYIPNATALKKTEISGYSNINNTKKQVEKINTVIEDTDKVYFIYQYESDSLGGAELVNAPALYYLDDKVSNYLGLPWRFTENGCNIRLENFDMTLQELPNIWAQNGFTYLWVYETDEYLTEEMPNVILCDEMESASLYRIVYENGMATKLEYVCSLK